MRRKWLWLAGAVAVLWLARTARAETEAEYFQGPYAPRPPAQPATPAPKVANPASAAAPAKPAASAAAAKRPVYQGYAAESARTATRLPPDEREARNFLRAAAASARFEVEAARLAATRAESPRVLAFASELADYHAAAEAELLHLLAARGMAPPMMDNADRKSLNRLTRLSGSRFDREFVDLVGRGRQRGDVQQFEKAVTALNDPVLKAWIDRQLPTLRQQETSAAKLASWNGARREDVRRTSGTR